MLAAHAHTGAAAGSRPASAATAAPAEGPVALPRQAQPAGVGMGAWLMTAQPLRTPRSRWATRRAPLVEVEEHLRGPAPDPRASTRALTTSSSGWASRACRSRRPWPRGPPGRAGPAACSRQARTPQRLGVPRPASASASHRPSSTAVTRQWTWTPPSRPAVGRRWPAQLPRTARWCCGPAGTRPTVASRARIGAALGELQRRPDVGITGPRRRSGARGDPRPLRGSRCGGAGAGGHGEKILRWPGARYRPSRAGQLHHARGRLRGPRPALAALFDRYVVDLSNHAGTTPSTARAAGDRRPGAVVGRGRSAPVPGARRRTTRGVRAGGAPPFPWVSPAATSAWPSSSCPGRCAAGGWGASRSAWCCRRPGRWRWPRTRGHRARWRSGVACVDLRVPALEERTSPTEVVQDFEVPPGGRHPRATPLSP